MLSNFPNLTLCAIMVTMEETRDTCCVCGKALALDQLFAGVEACVRCEEVLYARGDEYEGEAVLEFGAA